MKKLSVQTFVAIGVGAALFLVLGRFASIPVFANTYICLQYAVLCFLAVLYGPVAGVLIGLIGHALIDFTSYGPWWSWIIASAAVGLIVGLIAKLKRLDLDSGKIGASEIIWFNVANLIGNGLAWGIIAPALDILIYQEPADKVFTQGLIAGASNIVITAILGTLLMIGYGRTRTQKGSLDKE